MREPGLVLLGVIDVFAGSRIQMKDQDQGSGSRIGIEVQGSD